MTIEIDGHDADLADRRGRRARRCDSRAQAASSSG